MDSAKLPAEVPVRYHEFSPAEAAWHLDPDSQGMLNAAFTRLGLEPEYHGYA